MAKIRNTEYVRQKIEEAMQVAEGDRKRKLLAQRLDLARAGINAFKRNDISLAVKNFFSYIRILEDVKGVGPGGLMPQHFNPQTDVRELLMLSGVYWDLTRIFDRVKSNSDKEFLHYLEKYVIFSKGMTFQPLSAESLRKYIGNDKPRHRDEFKSAYQVLSVAKCFVTGALVDDLAIETIPALRQFRDQVLRKFHLGRRFIYGYYQLGPRLARWITGWPAPLRKALAKGLDFVGRRL